MSRLPAWRDRQLREKYAPPTPPLRASEAGDPEVEAVWCNATLAPFCLLCERHAVVGIRVQLDPTLRCVHCHQRIDHVLQPEGVAL